MATRRFNQGVDPAATGERTPGKWLASIPQEITDRNGTIRPGIEVSETRNGNEMWKALFVVTDDEQLAPTGSYIWENLVWDGGPGESRIYALMKAMGHPVDQWRRETDPSKIPAITPEMFINRDIVYRCKIGDRGYLEADGFNPFLPPTTERGPAKAAAQAPQASATGQAATAQTVSQPGGNPLSKLPF